MSIKAILNSKPHCFCIITTGSVECLHLLWPGLFCLDCLGEVVDDYFYGCVSSTRCHSSFAKFFFLFFFSISGWRAVKHLGPVHGRHSGQGRRQRRLPLRSLRLRLRPAGGGNRGLIQVRTLKGGGDVGWRPIRVIL
jgi:hypothetical protein